MILTGLFAIGAAVVAYNYGFVRGYDAKEKDSSEAAAFWKEVEGHGSHSLKGVPRS